MGELHQVIEGMGTANEDEPTLHGKTKMNGDIDKGKYCQSCGRWMWAMDIPDYGFLWHCPHCRESVHPDGTKLLWYQPRRDLIRRPTNERKYQGADPCPQCGRRMWVVEIPEYGSRKQCESCRISVVPGGAILEWRSQTPTETGQ